MEWDDELRRMAMLAPSEVDLVKETLDNVFYGVVSCRTAHTLVSHFGIAGNLLNEAIALFAGPDAMKAAAEQSRRLSTRLPGAQVAVAALAANASEDSLTCARALATLVGVETIDDNLPVSAACAVLGMCKATAELQSTIEVVDGAGRRRVPKPIARATFDVVREDMGLTTVAELHHLCADFGLSLPQAVTQNHRPPLALLAHGDSLLMEADPATLRSFASSMDVHAAPHSAAPSPEEQPIRMEDFEQWFGEKASSTAPDIKPRRLRMDERSQSLDSVVTSMTVTTAMGTHPPAELNISASGWSTIGEKWQTLPVADSTTSSVVPAQGAAGRGQAVVENRRNARLRAGDELDDVNDVVVQQQNAASSPRHAAETSKTTRRLDDAVSRLMSKRRLSTVEALRDPSQRETLNPVDLLRSDAKVSRRLRDLMRAPLPGPRPVRDEHAAVPTKTLASATTPDTNTATAAAPKPLTPDRSDGLAREHRNAFRLPFPLHAVESSKDMFAVRSHTPNLSLSVVASSSATSSLLGGNNRSTHAELMDRLASDHVLDAGAHLVLLRNRLSQLRVEASDIRRRRKQRGH